MTTKKFASLMAMASMFGGMEMGAYGFKYPKGRTIKPTGELPNSLTEEEKAKIIEERKDNLLSDLMCYADRVSKEFPNWLVYEVGNGYTLLASNQKNANKVFNKLLKSNLLSLKDLVDSN